MPKSVFMSDNDHKFSGFQATQTLTNWLQIWWFLLPPWFPLPPLFTSITHRIQQNAITYDNSFIINDKNQNQPEEEIHRVKSGMVLNLELPCPLPWTRGILSSQHFNVFTNQEAYPSLTVSFSVQSFYRCFLHRCD